VLLTRKTIRVHNEQEKFSKSKHDDNDMEK